MLAGRFGLRLPRVRSPYPVSRTAPRGPIRPAGGNLVALLIELGAVALAVAQGAAGRTW